MAKNQSDEEAHYHLEAGVPIFTPALQDPDPQKRAEREAAQAYSRQQVALQTKIFRTQVALVVFGIIGAGTSLWQAKTAQTSADTAEKSIYVAQRGLREAQRSNVLQSAQAEKSLKGTIDIFQKQQRAWVGVKDPVTDPAGVKITLPNTGATPAINVIYECCVFTMQSDSLPAPTYEGIRQKDIRRKSGPPIDAKINRYLKEHDALSALRRRQRYIREWKESHPVFKRHGVIAPGASPAVLVSGGINTGVPIGKAFYAVGEVTYNDVFTSTTHHTTICLVQTPSGFGICTDGQKMD